MVPIKINNVVKCFGETRALDSVSLDIKAGELFFLLGPSGCGKTTLLRSLAGFYFPEEGSIAFGDLDVTHMAPHKRRTGMMFQSYALWPHMTIYQNVAFGLEQQGLDKVAIKSRTLEALESVQMAQYAERKPNQLSGGQQQRIALARALVIRPRCLLLDEPLSNLDAKLRLEMRLEIRRICKTFNLTTVYVTHDQKEALSIADRMAVLHQGRILQIGTPAEVYKRPNSQFVASFIGEANFIPGTIVRAGGGEALVETPIGAIRGSLSDPLDEPSVGAAIKVLIRPETLSLSPMPPDENAFAGNIGESVYYGEVAHYAFETNGQTLAISELNPRHLSKRNQSPLYAWVMPEDVVILTH
jgi:iron(III) transport system ATP-binding protein